MRKKKLILGFLICAMSLSLNCMSAFAEVDEWGNEIDWNTDDIGNEDSAGGEIKYVPINADQLETEREVMTPEESEAVQEIVASTEQSVETETGIITTTFLPPDNWRGSNVVLTVYPLDTNGLPRATEKKNIYMYKQNEYVAREELNVGKYQVYQASVVGDRGNVFPMLTDISEFTVESGGAVININIELAGSNHYQTVEDKESASGEIKADTVAPTETESKQENRFVTFLKDNVIFAVIGLILGTVYLICKRKGEY